MTVIPDSARTRMGLGRDIAARAGASRSPPAYGIAVVDEHVDVQRRASSVAEVSNSTIQSAARQGTSGAGSRLPHAAAIQRSFGRHDVSSIVAHVDSRAATGTAAMGALAFTRGEHVAFAHQPELRLAAHEATHVIQQRAGLRLPGGVGRVGDRHEQAADAVADRVRAGRSAEDLLDRDASSCSRSTSTTEPAAVQRYAVLGPTKILNAEPASRPWFGYPYAVAAGGDLVAQAHAVGVDGQHEFLDANASNTANTSGAGLGFSLRVSNDNQMAVEHSDLTQRQPKLFFATQAIVDASNLALAAAHSRFTLVADGGATIKMLTGWSTDRTLRRVTPRFDAGDADLAPQNCNAIAARIMGQDPEAVGGQGGHAAFAAAMQLAPRARVRYQRAYDDLSQGPEVLDHWTNEIAKEYVANRNSRDVERLHVNQHAAPNVGGSYMIGSIGAGAPLDDGRARVHDYESDTDRDLGWPYHFGGVVAQSGTDRITLENYARGDNRANNRDPRWYFQMYGTARGQSFHEFHKAKLDYANPLTVGL